MATETLTEFKSMIDMTLHYLSPLRTIYNTSDMVSGFKSIYSAHRQTVHTLIVTNVEGVDIFSYSGHLTPYVLRITSQGVNYQERNPVSCNEIQVDFTTGEIKMNELVMSGVFYRAFNRHLRQIISDVITSAARVYEERLPIRPAITPPEPTRPVKPSPASAPPQKPVVKAEDLALYVRPAANTSDKVT